MVVPNVLVISKFRAKSSLSDLYIGELHGQVAPQKIVCWKGLYHLEKYFVHQILSSLPSCAKLDESVMLKKMLFHERKMVLLYENSQRT